MSTKDWTPAETAAYDQELASANTTIDFWIEALHEQTAKHGPTQGLATVTLALNMCMNKETQAALFIVALNRLAGG